MFPQTLMSSAIFLLQNISEASSNLAYGLSAANAKLRRLITETIVAIKAA